MKKEGLNNPLNKFMCIIFLYKKRKKNLETKLG